MDDLIVPNLNASSQANDKPEPDQAKGDEPKTARAAWDNAYKKQDPATNATLKVLESAKAGLGAYEQTQEYYKGAAQAERDAKEKEARQVLTDEELEGAPEEVKDFYNESLSRVFQLEGVKVTPNDPEWLFIEAEIEDPTSSPSRTLIAAQEAAQRKKQRLQGMSKRDVIDRMYQPE